MNDVQHLEKIKINNVDGNVVDNGAALVGFSRMFRLLDVRLFAYLMGMMKQSDSQPVQLEPSRTISNTLTRLVREHRILVQQTSSRERLFYRAKGTRPIERDYIAHTISISESLVGFVLALRQICNVREASPFTDAKLIQPWAIWKLEDIEPQVIPDKLFSTHILGKGKLHFALEQETGKIFDQSKHAASMRGYLAWRKKFCLDTNGVNDFDILNFRVLFLSADDDWSDNLRKICRNVYPRPNQFFLFSSLQHWSLNDPIALTRSPIWRTAWDDEPQWLITETTYEK